MSVSDGILHLLAVQDIKVTLREGEGYGEVSFSLYEGHQHWRRLQWQEAELLLAAARAGAVIAWDTRGGWLTIVMPNPSL